MIFDPVMTSVKPYFIQALHEWITDNGLTPLVVVDATYEGVIVPEAVIEEGKVILNVSYEATENLQMDEELLTLNARFSGKSYALIVPMESISAIYARENSKGMMFEVEYSSEEVSKTPEEESSSTVKSKSHLKLVD